MPVRSRIASRRVIRRQGALKSTAGDATARPGGTDDRLEASGGILVVGVGLIPLDHRELRVVLGRETLVAEVLAELVDPLEPADDAALEVELGRDAQVQRAIERVVVGHERSRRSAAVERLEDRGLHLDEPVVVERAANRADDARARDEQGARLLVGDQVELAAAKARLDVAQPVIIIGRRAQGLGEQREGADAQRELAAACADRDAVDAERGRRDRARRAREALLAELVDARVQLDPARAIDEVDERRACPPRGGPRDDRRRGGRRRSPRRRSSSGWCSASTAAIGSTPSNSCGKRVDCRPRVSRSSFARRAAISSSSP